MTTWTMYYGPHPVQRGITFARVEELTREWEMCLAQGKTWFTTNTLVPKSLAAAEVRLRAARDAPIAFLPDTPA